MSRDDIIAVLRRHEAELHELGVLHLSLFGSVARGEGGPDSDIDIAASFDPTARLSAFDIAGIEARLSEILARPVDLFQDPPRRPYLRREIERDRIRAF